MMRSIRVQYRLANDAGNPDSTDWGYTIRTGRVVHWTDDAEHAIVQDDETGVFRKVHLSDLTADNVYMGPPT